MLSELKVKREIRAEIRWFSWWRKMLEIAREAINSSWETMIESVFRWLSPPQPLIQKTFYLGHVFSFLWFVWSILSSLIPRIVVYGKTTSDGGFRWPVGWFSETLWHFFTTVRSNLQKYLRARKRKCSTWFWTHNNLSLKQALFQCAICDWRLHGVHPFKE